MRRACESPLQANLRDLVDQHWIRATNILQKVFKKHKVVPKTAHIGKDLEQRDLPLTTQESHRA